MSTQEPQDFYPQADQPFAAPAEYLETSRETIWFNPTDKDCVLDVHIGTTPCYSKAAQEAWRRMRPEQKWEARTGRRRYVIKAGQTKAIPRDFDLEIQQTQCLETSCLQRPLYCTDPSHHRIVVAGLGPQLVNRGWQEVPRLHPSLDTRAAQTEQAMQAAAQATVAHQKAAMDLANANLQLEVAQKEIREANEARRAAERTAEEATRRLGEQMAKPAQPQGGAPPPQQKRQ